MVNNLLTKTLHEPGIVKGFFVIISSLIQAANGKSRLPQDPNHFSVAL
jgi:hypothetical protein